MNYMDKSIPQLSSKLGISKMNMNKGKGKPILMVKNEKFKKKHKKPLKFKIIRKCKKVSNTKLMGGWLRRKFCYIN